MLYPYLRIEMILIYTSVHHSDPMPRWKLILPQHLRCTDSCFVGYSESVHIDISSSGKLCVFDDRVDEVTSGLNGGFWERHEQSFHFINMPQANAFIGTANVVCFHVEPEPFFSCSSLLAVIYNV